MVAYRAKLTAIAYIEYQYKKGVKKLRSTEEVADAFAATRDVIKDWPVELRAALGNLEVERVITAARNSGTHFLDDLKHSSPEQSLCHHFEDQYGKPALLRAAKRYKARFKKGVRKPANKR